MTKVGVSIPSTKSEVSTHVPERRGVLSGCHRIRRCMVTIPSVPSLNGNPILLVLACSSDWHWLIRGADEKNSRRLNYAH
jgi:hypothetical protein